MLMPFEKIAVDALDERTLNQFARAAGILRRGTIIMNVVKPLGKLLLGTGRTLGRGIERYGDALAKHPTRTLLWSVPAATSIAGAPVAIDKALNNVHPENEYRY